jgi:hypothetical protein
MKHFKRGAFLCRQSGVNVFGAAPESMNLLKPPPSLKQPARIDDVSLAKGGSYGRASY